LIDLEHARPGELNLAILAIRRQHLVHESNVVVRIQAQTGIGTRPRKHFKSPATNGYAYASRGSASIAREAGRRILDAALTAARVSRGLQTVWLLI
jgi:hypothetical protein